MMYRWSLAYLFIFMFCVAHGGEDFTEKEEDDDLDFYLGKLYEENEDTIDLHDMLNYPGKREQAKKDVKRPIIFEENLNTPDKETCSFDKLRWSEEAQKLTKCLEQLNILERDIDNDKQKMRALEKKLLKEGSVDVMSFYRRLVYRFWNVLKLEDAEHILKDPDEAMIRFLSMHFTKDDIITLQDFLHDQNNIQQVDEFLQNAMKLEEVTDDTQQFNIISVWESAMAVFEVGKNVEVWLYVLCMGFLVLATWAIYLFIKDIQQELRWMRVIMMMIVLLFFICCMWHWRHMHKVAESRRHAQMMKRGFTDIPEECKPGVQAAKYSAWEWIKVRVFGAPDVCEKYFEEIMVDPSEEITPAMVIAETLAKFVLQPLQHLGSESAKFLTNFYQNVPVVYHVPATIFFIVLLIIILFAFCGYGIDFPLWMGGIRPIYRTEMADTSDVDRITKEAIAQLKSDREKFMTESRMMLSDIAQAAVTSQAQAGIQPLLMMSSTIIESQLEKLIARQLSQVVSQTFHNNTSVDTGHSSQGNVTPQNEDNVFTITSTPLRKCEKLQITDNDFNSGEELETVGEKKLLRPEDGASSLVATTDAVHYRLKGTGRKGALVPKGGSSSTPGASSETSATEVSWSKGRKNTSKNQSQDIHSKNTIELESPAHSSEVSSSHSLYNVSSDDSGAGENFYNRVKSILEDSANSSINAENSNISCDSEHRVLDVNEGRSMRSEELELSNSGVRFLKKIKKVMTP
ncbi:LOW QUALITY PROTEIN: uncharacterized protein LOC135207510 [Macrobrachium nipponense]|uniref:LOW QUALITY PROTEIN: uncharacterized protein LOC135207510 n=1 Tax=Macrobrachium nipponense TaxID=159736 RepID=UPI0030C8AB3A